MDLNKIIQQLLEDLEADIEQTGAIQVDPLPTVQGNGRQLQQLFQNLLSNALKYTTPGEAPRITVTCTVVREESHSYQLTEVTDKDIGFEQEHAEKIFQIFTRLHGKDVYRVQVSGYQSQKW